MDRVELAKKWRTEADKVRSTADRVRWEVVAETLEECADELDALSEGTPPVVDQAKLIDACRRLVALVDAPEAGLAAWHVMCAGTAKEVAAASAGVPLPVARLRAGLACHIDHDEPPGLGANQLASELLELVDGLTTFQAVMLLEHVRELRAKFGRGA